MTNSDSCPVFNEGRCRSCSLLAINPNERESSALKPILNLCSKFNFDYHKVGSFFSPKNTFPSRGKVKLSVSGTIDQPIFGLLDPKYQGIPLLDCPLVQPEVNSFLLALKEQIPNFKIPPYDINLKRGELKAIHVITNHEMSEGILRFVLRSTESVPRIKKLYAALEIPSWLKVISVNIQPLPAAIPEGPEEINLSLETTIKVSYGEFYVRFGAQSFIQVTHEVAAKLYAALASAVHSNGTKRLLDLYCGSGPFSFASQKYIERGLGLEVSNNSIECAKLGASEQAFKNLEFRISDVDNELRKDLLKDWDGVVVNPPRRGVSKQTLLTLIDGTVRTIYYSSCNPETLSRDLEILTPHYEIKSIQPFNMFPLTHHIETLVVLSKR